MSKIDSINILADIDAGREMTIIKYEGRCHNGKISLSNMAHILAPVLSIISMVVI